MALLSFDEAGHGNVRMTGITLIIPRDRQCFVQIASNSGSTVTATVT